MGLGSLFKKLTGTQRVTMGPSRYGGEQQDVLTQLKEASLGKAPSVAQMAGREASERGLAQTSSAIRSAPGLSSALRARLGTRASAQQQSEVARQTGQLRAQEMATARGQRAAGLAQALTSEQARQSAEMQAAEATQARRGKLFSDVMTAGTGLLMPKPKTT